MGSHVRSGERRDAPDGEAPSAAGSEASTAASEAEAEATDDAACVAAAAGSAAASRASVREKSTRLCVALSEIASCASCAR